MKGEFPKKEVCPTCGHYPDLSELINKDLATSYAEPDFKAHGYRFWFRDYIPAAESTCLIGLALAWPEPDTPEENRRYFYAVAGTETVHEYYRHGVGFRIDFSSRPPTEQWGMEDFKQAKGDAMDRLLKYVEAAAK